jgi:lysophospholipase L1-like esterase
MRVICHSRIVLVCVGLLAAAAFARADDVKLGNMRANKILFLGNSITTCGDKYWGLSASAAEKDYAHLLAAAIDAKTGGHLTILREVAPVTKPDGGVDLGDANAINIADVFERGYASYNASKIQKQLDWKADIVILQFGENIPMPAFKADVFTDAFKKLVSDLKASSNPHIFMPSYILGANANIDAIKRKVCEEDPSHRVFVDLSAVGKDASNMGDYNHPNDKGMAVIADLIFKAVTAHSEAK